MCNTEETVMITLWILVIFIIIQYVGVALLYDDVKPGSGFVLAKLLALTGGALH